MAARLCFLAGAPGAGKSTLAPLLASRAEGRAFVADMDDLLDPNGALLGVSIVSRSAQSVWPAYNELWMRIVALVHRSGLPVVLFGPLQPAELERAAVEVGIGHIQAAVLDCADPTRRERLEQRGWDAPAIAGALEDARALRNSVPTRFSTDGPFDETSGPILRWAELHR